MWFYVCWKLTVEAFNDSWFSSRGSDLLKESCRKIPTVSLSDTLPSQGLSQNCLQGLLSTRGLSNELLPARHFPSTTLHCGRKQSVYTVSIFRKWFCQRSKASFGEEDVRLVIWISGRVLPWSAWGSGFDLYHIIQPTKQQTNISLRDVSIILDIVVIQVTFLDSTGHDHFQVAALLRS